MAPVSNRGRVGATDQGLAAVPRERGRGLVDEKLRQVIEALTGGLVGQSA